MYDVFLLLVTALIGVALSFFVVTVLNVGGSTDDSLIRDLQQIVMQIVASLIAVVLTPVLGIWNIGIDLGTMFASRAKWSVAAGLFVIATFMMHYYHADILSILDDSWKCFLIPLMDNIIEPFLQISRVFYGLGMPVANTFLVMHAQVIKAWYVTLTACSHINMFKMFSELVMALITGTRSFTSWFYDPEKKDPTTNTFYYNDFDIALPVNHTLTAISIGQKVVACACRRFEPLFNIGFFITMEPHVTAAINNLFQAAIRTFQMMFRMLLTEFPDIYKVSFKLERGITEGGLALDSIMFNTVANIIKVFDPDFVLARYPKEGLFTALAYGAAGAVDIVATIVVNGPLHLMASFDPEVSALDEKVWSMQQAFAKMYQAVQSGAIFAQWVVYILEQMITSKKDLSQIFVDDNSPLELKCDWARDVDDHKYVRLSYTIGCSLFNYGILYINAYAIVSGMGMELLFKSIFTQEQNVFRTLQRWEGPTIARKKVYTCLDRQEDTAYNYDTGVVNSNGWIWTQDLAECQCDSHYGRTLEEGEKPFNPWCGQPNLNFDIFAPLDALVMHVSHGILGPGFGDAFPFIKPLRSININIEDIGLDKSIVLPLALPPITRTAIESARILTRVALSFGDIVTGHFFNYQTNCGHGMNKEQLVARWKYMYPKLEVPTADSTTDGSPNLRWTPCEDKEYNAMQGEKRIEICDTNNNKNDCMCSYLQPLKVTDKCRCIARYPDLDITASSQQVGDLIEERFTSGDVAIHWCNSMIIEWTFQNTGAFADALDYIVSLGPLNPTCDVADRIFDGDEIGINEKDARTSDATYEITTTPTLSFLKEFASSTEKLNNVADLYSNRPTGCAIVDNEDGEKEWACDVSNAQSITSLDPSVDLTNAGCTIYGRDDFFCSAGLWVRNNKRLTMNIARQAVNDGIALIAGNFADVNLKTLPRLCDYERQQGALAAMVAGLIPKIDRKLRKPIAKYLNIIAQVIYVHGIRTGLVVINMATTIVQDFIGPGLTEDSLITTFKSGARTILQGQVYLVREFFQTTGEFLKAIAPGAEKICFDIVKIMDLIYEKLEGILMDIVASIVQMLLQAIAIMSGDTSVIDAFFKNFIDIALKIIDLLIAEWMKILGLVFKFLGPVGSFFETLLSVVCPMLNIVMGAIDSAIKAASLGLSAGIGWKKITCPSETSEGRRLHERHHFLRSDNEDILRKVTETLDWSGSSVCDDLMNGLVDYSFSELRPLEKAKWKECLELKYIGVEMATYFDAPEFPTDIMYNWKRKYTMAFELMQAIHIAIPHVFSDNFNWANVRFAMYDAGINADMYMKIFQSFGGAFRKVLNSIEATNMIKLVLEHIDPNYGQKGNPSKAATAWRVFDRTKSVYNEITHEWEARDMSKDLWTAVDASHHAKTHLHRWWNDLGKDEPTKQSHTERVFTNLKSHWNRGMSETIKHSPHHSKLHWLGVPLKTAPKTCAERSSAPWCTECSIIDNIIEQAIEHGDGMSEFYSQYFGTVIIHDVSEYFNTIIEDNAQFFDRRFSKLTATDTSNKQSAEELVSKNAERWTRHVANDWSFLVTNFTEYAFNSSHKKQWLGHVDKFLDSSRKFFTYTNDTYVPFFGYSLFHMYDYILFSSCDVQNTIFIPLDSDGSYADIQQQRLVNMDNALLACLIVTLVIVFNTTWSVIPLVWLANTVILGFIISALYLYMVYDWRLSCAPLLPYTLVEDIHAWYVTRLETGCFYKILPFMALSPSEDMCLTCSAPDPWTSEKIRTNHLWRELNSSTWNVTTGTSQFTTLNKTYYDIELGQRQTYLDCSTYTHENHIEGQLTLPELMMEYNIFWTPVFWFRWQFPEAAAFFVENGIFAFDTVIGKLMLAAWQEEPIDPVWKDCYHAMWLNNVLSVAVASITIYITTKLTVIAVQTFTQVAMLIWYTYMSLNYMTLAVEKSVIIDE